MARPIRLLILAAASLAADVSTAQMGFPVFPPDRAYCEAGQPGPMDPWDTADSLSSATGFPPPPIADRLEAMPRGGESWEPFFVDPATLEQATAEPLPVEPTPIESKPTEATWLSEADLWEGTFEFGLDGTEGNSRTLNFRVGLEAKRETPYDIVDLDLDYHKKTADFRETANRLFLDARIEALYEDSPWTVFVHNSTEYDEFKPFDVRVALDSGIGYQLIDWETTTLTARIGSGASHEIGGPDDAYVPEAVAGLEFEHQLTGRQKFSLTADYTPSMLTFDDYRLSAKAGWEIMLDEEMNLSMKFSLLDRYDSTPNGAKPNDLDYSVTLLWGF